MAIMLGKFQSCSQNWAPAESQNLSVSFAQGAAYSDCTRRSRHANAFLHDTAEGRGG